MTTIRDRKEKVTCWQYSLVDYVKYGDCNSKCFHQRANTRCVTNSIVKLCRLDGALYSRHDEF